MTDYCKNKHKCGRNFFYMTMIVNLREYLHVKSSINMQFVVDYNFTTATINMLHSH